MTTLGATEGVASGTRGALADATLSYPYAVSPRLTLIPSINTTWADSKYNNRYFGVNAQQSFNSGLPQYAPGGGLKDASATMTANYQLTDHWVLGGAIGATTLLNKVKDSPICRSPQCATGWLRIRRLPPGTLRRNEALSRQPVRIIVAPPARDR